MKIFSLPRVNVFETLMISIPASAAFSPHNSPCTVRTGRASRTARAWASVGAAQPMRWLLFGMVDDDVALRDDELRR